MDFSRAGRMLDPRKVVLIDHQKIKIEILGEKNTLICTIVRMLYKSLAGDICEDADVLLWWKSQQKRLPSWYLAARKFLPIPPSSACAKRVFSVMNQTFGSSQHQALNDYIETSVILQYNNRK